jgi:hypothetical protein
MDGWASCGGHPDITFLPDDCLLCPTHGEMYEEIACNPWLLEKGEDEDEEDGDE